MGLPPMGMRVIGGSWASSVSPKWSAVCTSLRALLPRSTPTLELKAFTQFLLLCNGLTPLTRRTQRVLEVSKKRQEVASARSSWL